MWAHISMYHFSRSVHQFIQVSLTLITVVRNTPKHLHPPHYFTAALNILTTRELGGLNCYMVNLNVKCALWLAIILH